MNREKKGNQGRKGAREGRDIEEETEEWDQQGYGDRCRVCKKGE